MENISGAAFESHLIPDVVQPALSKEELSLSIRGFDELKRSHTSLDGVNSFGFHISQTDG